MYTNTHLLLAYRWGSKVDMLICLRLLKEFCDNNCEAFPDLKLSKEQWSEINQLIAELMPSKKSTKMFQSEQLTLGDFYATWIRCKMETEAIGTPFALAIVNAMRTREKLLLTSDAFVAAICLDARYRLFF